MIRNIILICVSLLGLFSFSSFLNERNVSPIDNPIIMQLDVPDVLVRYSQDFITDGFNNGLEKKMQAFEDFRIILYRDNLMGNEQWGLCDDKNKIIYYDEKLLSAHQAIIRSVVYHEMAHCLLNRPHMYIYDLQNNIPTSIMYPYTNNLPPNILEKNWEQFKTELFTNVESQPISYQTSMKQNFKMFASYLFKIETKSQWIIYKTELFNFIDTLPLKEWLWNIFTLGSIAYVIIQSLLGISTLSTKKG